MSIEAISTEEGWYWNRFDVHEMSMHLMHCVPLIGAIASIWITSDLEEQIARAKNEQAMSTYVRLLDNKRQIASAKAIGYVLSSAIISSANPPLFGLMMVLSLLNLYESFLLTKDIVQIRQTGKLPA